MWAVCLRHAVIRASLFPLSSNCPSCFLLMWAPRIFRVDLPVDRTRQFDADSKAHCAFTFMWGQISSSLICHKGVMMMVVKALVRFPHLLNKHSLVSYPTMGQVAELLLLPVSALCVQSEWFVITPNTISSPGTWINQTQHLYFQEMLILVTVWLF